MINKWDNKKRTFWQLSCTDILGIICAAAVPIALGIYTAITYQQEQDQAKKIQDLSIKQAIESRQDAIFDQFLSNIYKLEKNGYLNDTMGPWAFANAYYRAAHRQLDPVRKGDVLQFLKENRLIGRNNCTALCGLKEWKDIIRLNELSFDNVHFKSETGTLNRLNLECVVFDQVSMSNAIFTFANLNGASFDFGRLDNVNFGNSSLTCVTFNGTDLRGVDFRGLDLRGVVFCNVDLSTAKLTEEQLGQATFFNSTMPNGMTTSTTTTTITTTPTTTKTTTKTTARSSTTKLTTTTFAEKQSSTIQPTSAPCARGYVRTPSDICVNLLIDFNNCGSFGYVCASNYTSCSFGACSAAPAVQLAGGVAVFGWGVPRDIDDEYVPITLPFAITMYKFSTTTPYIQSNGIVCFGNCFTTYQNTPLPCPDFSEPTAFGFWDDLHITVNSSQTVYYGATGAYPNRTLVFEFYTVHEDLRAGYYRFQIVFYEASPGIVSYYYYQAADGGASATIGVQSKGNGPYMQYSYNQKMVPVGSSTTTNPTLALTFNTNTGTYTTAD